MRDDLIKRLRGAIVGSHRSVRDDYKLMKEAADALAMLTDDGGDAADGVTVVDVLRKERDHLNTINFSDLIKRLRFGSTTHLGSSKLNLEAAEALETIEQIKKQDFASFDGDDAYETKFDAWDDGYCQGLIRAQDEIERLRALNYQIVKCLEEGVDPEIIRGLAE